MRIITTVILTILIPFILFSNDTGMSYKNRLILAITMALMIYLMWKGTIKENKEEKEREQEINDRQEEYQNNMMSMKLNSNLRDILKYDTSSGVILSVNDFESVITDEIKYIIIDFINKLPYKKRVYYVTYAYEVFSNSNNEFDYYYEQINDDLNNLFNELVDLLKENDFQISDSKIEIECLAVYVKAKIIEIELLKLIKKHVDISEKFKTELYSIKEYTNREWYWYYFSDKKRDIFTAYYYYYFVGYFDISIFSNGLLCLKEKYYLIKQDIQPISFSGEKLVFHWPNVKIMYDYYNNDIYKIIGDDIQIVRKLEDNRKDKFKKHKMSIVAGEKNVLTINLNKLTGIEFERFLASYYENKGYEVEFTKTTSDKGVDLLIKKDKLIAVQAKRYKDNVGISAVQQVYAGKIYYNCDEAVVITNSYFTDSAKDIAKKTNVGLIDYDKLKYMMLDINVVIE